MRNKTVIAIVAILIFLVQAACAIGSTGTQEPEATQDVNALVSTGMALTAAANQFQLPTNTQQAVIILPTNTLEPVLPTNTTAPAVTGVINYGANCRSGPGANFPILKVVEKGTQVSVVGTAKATDLTIWWVIQSTGNPECWVIDDAVAIAGDKASVVKVVSPPTPTPVPPPYWGGTWTTWLSGYFSGTATESFQMEFVQSGNVLTTTFIRWGYTFNFIGYVSADGMTVNGTLERVGDSGQWSIILMRVPSNLNQFKGSYYLPSWPGFDGNWCGAKGGAGKPDPCWVK